MYSLRSSLSESLYLSISEGQFSGKLFLVNIFFLLVHWIYHPTVPWPAKFLLRYMLIVLWGRGEKFHCMWCFFLVVSFKILSLPSILVSFITMHVGEDLSGLNLTGDLWASWISISRSLCRNGKFSAIIILNILSSHFLLSSIWDHNYA